MAARDEHYAAELLEEVRRRMEEQLQRPKELRWREWVEIRQVVTSQATAERVRDMLWGMIRGSALMDLMHAAPEGTEINIVPAGEDYAVVVTMHDIQQKSGPAGGAS